MIISSNDDIIKENSQKSIQLVENGFFLAFEFISENYFIFSSQIKLREQTKIKTDQIRAPYC